MQSDVAKLADIDKLYKAISEKYGKIDILFANAGVAKFAPLADSTEALYNEVFDINVKGLFFTVQKALPFLNNGASIILNSSVVNELGSPNTSIYSATKAAVRSFARTWASELVDRAIRVNVVSPGPIATPIFGRTGLPQEVVDDFAKQVVAQVPLKRFGQPEEIASTVAFLASGDSTYITGVDLKVDGGMGQV